MMERRPGMKYRAASNEDLRLEKKGGGILIKDKRGKTVAAIAGGNLLRLAEKSKGN